MSEGARAVGTVLAGALRRRLLDAADDGFTPQSHRDAAALAAGMGLPAAARLLDRLAELRLGIIAPRGAGPSDPLATALAELRGLIALGEPAAPDSAVPDDAGADNAGADDAGEPVDVAGDCEALWAQLAAAEPDGLAALWRRLDARYAGCLPATLAAHPVDRPEALVDAFAHASLRAFLSRHRRLATAPFGSPTLFHAAARLDPGGLGPWFNNVSRLPRGPLDLIALVRVATGGSLDDAAQRWLVRLATGLERHHLPALAERLGDLGLGVALHGLLELARPEAPGRPDHHLVTTLRDAGLDLEDYRLAAEAQRIAALDRVDSALEWRILGSIHASAGEDVPAREAFRHALRFAPTDAEIAVRLVALEANEFAPFRLRRGFGERSRARRPQPPIPRDWSLVAAAPGVGR